MSLLVFLPALLACVFLVLLETRILIETMRFFLEPICYFQYSIFFFCGWDWKLRSSNATGYV